jgi:predicted transcriptional regulator
MREHDIGSLVVVDCAGKVAGILTERDIVGLAAEGADLSVTKVAGCMTTCVVTCSLSTPIRDVFRLMSGNQIRHLKLIYYDHRDRVLAFSGNTKAPWKPILEGSLWPDLQKAACRQNK